MSQPLLLLIGVFGWVIAACAFASSGLRDGSLCVSDTETEMIFRKRPGGRIFGAMMAVFFAVGPPVQYSRGLFDALQRHAPVPTWAYFTLLFGLAVGVTLGGLMIYLAGPNDLLLNRDRRTYRFLSGWPLGPRVRTGPWEDLAGIYVRRVTTDGTVRYLVGIAWQSGKGEWPQLGRFKRERDAEALANRVSAVVERLRMAPPAVTGTRSPRQMSR